MTALIVFLVVACFGCMILGRVGGYLLKPVRSMGANQANVGRSRHFSHELSTLRRFQAATEAVATGGELTDSVSCGAGEGFLLSGGRVEASSSPLSSSSSSSVRSIHQVVLEVDDKQTKHSSSSSNSNSNGQSLDLFKASILHKTCGPVPRSSKPSILQLQSSISTTSDNTEKTDNTETQESTSGEKSTSYTSTNASKAITDGADLFSLLEESLKWFFDSGGRIGQLAVSTEDSALLKAAQTMGFSAVPSPTMQPAFRSLLSESGASSSWMFACVPSMLQTHVLGRLQRMEGDVATLNDILGRLAHDLGDPESSIEYYTAALTSKPSASEVFRNLGSAYHSLGNTQMAFASYQQAVQLNPNDALVYLKLAFFYEGFAEMDWEDAADHAERCYHYYLDNVDSQDTAVLTRLGNLLVREHKSHEAIIAYDKVLALEEGEGLHGVWFNKAHAQIKVGDSKGAAFSLRRTLELNEDDPNRDCSSSAAARHMLRALDTDEALAAENVDDVYVRELFNAYGNSYDDHVKKLLYQAPRVIRQELAKIYKGKFTMVDVETNTVVAGGTPLDGENGEDIPLNLPSDGPGCTTIVPTIRINNTLDVLDLGCGTGLAGAWLKDYAKTLTGVDLSESMVEVARKKMIYQSLTVGHLQQYLEQANKAGKDFDLVVAADVLSYIGELGSSFGQVAKILRSGGHFAFTVEAVGLTQTQKSQKTQKRGVDTATDIDGNAEGEEEEGEGISSLSIDETFEGSEKGYKLLSSGRFGFSRTYVDRVIRDLPDVRLVMSREFSPRMEAGEPVPGYLYVVQKQ